MSCRVQFPQTLEAEGVRRAQRGQHLPILEPESRSATSALSKPNLAQAPDDQNAPSAPPPPDVLAEMELQPGYTEMEGQTA